MSDSPNPSLCREKSFAIKNFLFQFFFLYVFIVSYIIPAEIQRKLYLSYIFFPFFIIFFYMVRFFLYNEKINFWYFICILFLFFIHFFSGIFYFSNVEHISGILTMLIVISLVDYKGFQINSKVETLFFYLCFLGMAYQLTKYSFGIRRVMGYLDPNVTSFYFLMFFFWAVKRKSLLQFVMFGFVFFTLSRNYLYALIVFYFVQFIQPYVENIILFFNFYKYKNAFLFSLIFVLCVGFYFVNNVKGSGYESDVNRLTSVVDGSNAMRFSINHKFSALIFKDGELFFNGFGKDSLLLKKMFNKINIDNYPHNSFLEFIAVNGFLYSVVYFILLLHLLDFFLDKKNFSIIVSFLFFTMFLFTGYRNMYLILFILVLNISSRKLSFFRKN